MEVQAAAAEVVQEGREEDIADVVLISDNKASLAASSLKRKLTTLVPKLPRTQS